VEGIFLKFDESRLKIVFFNIWILIFLIKQIKEF